MIRLMLAIDLAEKRSPDLIARAAIWAGRMGGKLDLLTVDTFPYASVHDPAAQAVLAAEYQRLEADHQQLLDNLLTSVPEAIRGTAVRISSYRPAEAIADASKEHDLLMVGTHGRKGITGWFMGSVAERTIRLASIPTLVLRV